MNLRDLVSGLMVKEAQTNRQQYLALVRKSEALQADGKQLGAADVARVFELAKALEGNQKKSDAELLEWVDADEADLKLGRRAEAADKEVPVLSKARSEAYTVLSAAEKEVAEVEARHKSEMQAVEDKQSKARDAVNDLIERLDKATKLANEGRMLRERRSELFGVAPKGDKLKIYSYGDEERELHSFERRELLAAPEPKPVIFTKPEPTGPAVVTRRGADGIVRGPDIHSTTDLESGITETVTALS